MAVDVDPATRNWILRKEAGGMSRDELRAQLEDDGEDPDVVDAVLDHPREDTYAAIADHTGFLDQYLVTLKAVYGIDTHYFRSIDHQRLSVLFGVLLVNAAVPAVVTTMFISSVLDAFQIGGISGSIAGAAVYAGGMTLGLIVWTLLNAGVAHVFVVALGGRDARTTVKLYCALSVFLTALWIPFLNVFVLLYGYVATVRGLETVQGLGFYRALVAATVPPIVVVAGITAAVAL